MLLVGLGRHVLPTHERHAGAALFDHRMGRTVHLPGGPLSALKPRNAHAVATPKSNRAIGGPKSRTGISRKSPVVLNPPRSPYMIK